MKRFLFVAFFFATVTTAVAQQTSGQCATMEQDSINRIRYPEMGTLDQFEDRLQRHVEAYIKQRGNARGQLDIVTIPIVVHVVHKGEAVGAGMNISEAQIKAQIEVLNEDFRRKAGTPGFNNSSVGADIEIEFCLASVDPKGNKLTEAGIHRYNGGKDSWAREEIEANLKPTTIWDPLQYFNVWTLKFGGSSANLLGYAQFPDGSGLSGVNGGPAQTDGVVIQYSSFGSTDKGSFPVMAAPHDKGRTLSHETGHWLGLRHTWGDGNCATDYVDDTPPSQGPNYNCPVGKISCDGVTPLMVQNYMDYSNDACMNIFTKGQKARMRQAIELAPRRKALFARNLCNVPAPAPPIANFDKDRSNCVLAGSTVSFFDLSANYPNKYEWTFEGGNPGTSTAPNPKVTYAAGGLYNVTLKVSNDLGSNSITFEDFVDVEEEGICTNFSNFKPEFTPSVLNASDFGIASGYLTGNNSANNTAYAEYFVNECGYKYVSGVKIKFGQLNLTQDDARILITVWNALGPQGAPGDVLEQKEVLLKQVQEDIAANRYTEITLDRETPAAFGRAFHVGVEIQNNAGYTLAIVSSANDEATESTSWVRQASGEWSPMTLAYGANIAMDIKPVIGMNPSVQISASKLLATPGEQVILSGRGASIFSWSAQDGSVNDVLGPQLIVNPLTTTTYTLKGSGLELCYDNASMKIYVTGTQTPVEFTDFNATTDVHPNPGTNDVTVSVANSFYGDVTFRLQSMLGQDMRTPLTLNKQGNTLSTTFETGSLPAGMYLVNVTLGNELVLKKWIKK